MRSKKHSTVNGIDHFLGKDDVKQLFGGKICRNSPKSWCEKNSFLYIFLSSEFIGFASL